MSLDRSLKAANALIRHRNVLTRAERLDKLVEAEKWDEKKGILGLPKVGNRKQVTAGKVKEAAAEGDAAAPAAKGAKGAAAPAAKGAAAAKGAPAAKGAAAGKGAPAAKGAAAPAKKK